MKNKINMPHFFCAALFLGLSVFFASYANALSVDEVIRLRKAGISNKTIEIMLEHETTVKQRGGVGSYVLRSENGNQIIVYEASTPHGVEDYPLPLNHNAGGIDRMSYALGAEKREPPLKSRALQKYTLHLASFRNFEYAKEKEQKLLAQGIKAKISKVDLSEKGQWYRLLAGEFAKKKQAIQKGLELKNTGLIGSFRVISIK